MLQAFRCFFLAKYSLYVSLNYLDASVSPSDADEGQNKYVYVYLRYKF